MLLLLLLFLLLLFAFSLRLIEFLPFLIAALFFIRTLIARKTTKRNDGFAIEE